MEVVTNSQACYNDLAVPINNVKPFTMTLFRKPLHHVHSEFLYCAVSKEFYVKQRSKEFPSSGNLSTDYFTWLEHFYHLTPADVGSRVDFNCMDPRDIQVRHMACKHGKNPRANHYMGRQSISSAITNMHEMNAIGLTEFYHESMCLLKLRRTKVLPANCICGYEGKPGEADRGSYFRHGVPDHGKADMNLPKAYLDLINYLTQLDNILYSHVVERFIANLETSEQLTKLHIGCNSYAELRRVAYSGVLYTE